MKIFTMCLWLFPFIFSDAMSQELLWKLEGLNNPESVVYDAKRGVLFVSMQNYGGEKGDASIAQLSLEGKVIDPIWVTGLNEPKGIYIAGDRLFVSDVTELVEIDMNKKKIIKRHEAPGARFLNDVTSDERGNIFVSDMFNSSIYILNEEGLSLWIQDEKLKNPNGLLIDGDYIYVAAWGLFDGDNPLEADSGGLLMVSLSTKKIRPVETNGFKFGNLDGIQGHSEKGELSAFFLSDWVRGDIFVVNVYGVTRILSLPQSVGDIAYIQSQQVLIIPMAKQGEVIAYKIFDQKRIESKKGESK